MTFEPMTLGKFQEQAEPARRCVTRATFEPMPVGRSQEQAEPARQCVPGRSPGTRARRSAAARIVISLLPLLLFGRIAFAADWPQFRGPGSRGVSSETGLPTEFSEKTVAWKVPLPGPGPASPIVVDGTVIVTAAGGPRQERLHVLGIDAANGRTRWQRTLWATGPTVCNGFGGVAASTPASSGRLVFALFSSNDIACFDIDGNLQWYRALGYESPRTRNDVGMAASPLIAGDTIVVQLENPGVSFATGLDTSTGETRWRVDLESGGCWTTPALWQGKSAAEDLVVLQSRVGLTAHEPQSGKQVWRLEQPCSSISSTTACGEYLFAPINGLTALRYSLQSKGFEPIWQEQRLGPANICPVVHEGRVYVTKSAGIVVCGDAATGKVLWQLRLKGPFWGTPAIGDGHLYAANHDGLVQIVRLGKDSGELVSTGQIDSGVLASPAISGGAVYFRTNTHLWKIGHKASE
ncbi:MAG: PQQ-binding-like beta-propeller repeat protein [Pirellulales bacterium]|nr:PQQ-binding-like beta-propeller repeat protein [Pirellulales bacterium]